MSKAGKAAGLGLVIFATVWVVTLWQWYRTQRPVSGAEVAAHLLALPLALVAVAWGAAWLSQRLRELATAPVAPRVPPQARMNAHAPDAAPEVAASAHRWPMPVHVLAEALAVSAGLDAEQAWQQLRQGQARPQLDTRLEDANGCPILTGRVQELDADEWLQAHADWHEAPATEPMRDAVVRAAALLEGPLHRLLMALMARVPDSAVGMGAGDGLPVPSATYLSGVGASVSVADRQARSARAPVLSVQVAWPSAWSPEEQTHAAAWLRRQCGTLLDWSRQWGAREPQWLAATAPSPESFWHELAQWLEAVQADPRPQLRLVLAADSLVDEAGVQHLLARGDLFTSHHQSGRVPGEGAAGLLLGNAAWLALHGADRDAPQLWQPASAQRAQSADRIGRSEPGTLAGLLTQLDQGLHSAWHAGGPDETHEAPGDAGAVQVTDAHALPPAFGWVLSDADHRPGRTAELFEAVQGRHPGLDPMTRVLRLGDACGDLGMARALVPVALASAAVRGGWLADAGGAAGAGDAGSAVAQASAAAHSGVRVPLVQSSHARVVLAVTPPAPRAVAPSSPSSSEAASARDALSV